MCCYRLLVEVVNKDDDIILTRDFNLASASDI